VGPGPRARSWSAASSGGEETHYRRRWLGVGILKQKPKPKPEPEPNTNRPNYRSIWVFGFGFGSYMCYISGMGSGSVPNL
jgi:hypothetical protein